MAQADSKVLVLGALAGVAGISLAVACYKGYKSKRRASMPGYYLNCTNERAGNLMYVDSPSLAPGQAEVLDRLEALIQCVSELKDEMKALKNALPTLQDQVREELRGRERAEARRASPLHRTTPTRRKRAAGTISGSTGGGRSSEEAESEGGYITALTDSEEEELSDAEQRVEEQPADKLSILLERIDRLHQGTDSDKRESLSILLEQQEEFGQNSSFLWRLIRAYCDLHDASSTTEEKKTHAETGKRVGEEAVRLNPTCAESHQCQGGIVFHLRKERINNSKKAPEARHTSLHLHIPYWYAIMCGIMAEYDTIQNKIKNGYIFKDHLDKAIELNPQDPLSYYLLGRWCYAVAQLSWLERKVAATLFGEPPSATVEDALKNFLKVEEIHPGYSKLNYVFLAKCYKDLGQRDKARKMCEAACSMNTVSKEADEAQKELDLLCPLLGV